jgi:dipeptidyl aminopeptidase/acylaminoacyl peptidase
MLMIFIAFRRLVLLAVMTLTAIALQAAESPSLSAYGRLPDIEMMALSNSGSRVAAVMTTNGQHAVVLLTSELKTLRVVPLEGAKVRSMEWIGDDHLMLVISKTEILGPEYRNNSQAEFFHAYIISTDQSQEPRMVFDKDPNLLNAEFGTFGTRHNDGHWTTYIAGHERKRGARDYYIASGGSALYAVDVDKFEWHRVAAQGSQGESTTWLLGPEGNIAATFSIDFARGDWHLKAPGGRELASGTAPRGDAGLVALGRDGKSLIYRERDEKAGKTIWYEIPLDGSGAANPFANEEDIDSIYTDRNTGKLLGFLRVGPTARPEFFAPAQQKVVSEIYRAFPNLHVTLFDWTPDFSRVLVRTSGDGDSGTWYLVDMARMHATALGFEREAIGPDVVGPISVVRYKAQDGLDLDGILTLPPARAAKNLPLVMLPHGGPHAYDDAVFDWWAQAFASRGYAVFQPNFRGSTNRDEAFMRAGFGQWGRKMQTDISDAITELAKRGIVDPKRVCIVGASYGGYAALAGVTLQHGLYRCAVAVAPVSDLGELFSTEYSQGGGFGMLRRSLLEELGPSSGYDAVSPRQFASKADAPILLVHGRDDTVVPFRQSSQMADALHDAGKPYKFVVLKHEDHWLSSADTRQQMLDEAVAWVEHYDPPK